jgi:hypothetical protein
MLVNAVEDGPVVQDGALKLALTVAVAGIFFVGVIPTPLMDVARDAAAVFTAQ